MTSLGFALKETLMEMKGELSASEMDMIMDQFDLATGKRMAEFMNKTAGRINLELSVRYRIYRVLLGLDYPTFANNPYLATYHTLFRYILGSTSLLFPLHRATCHCIDSWRLCGHSKWTIPASSPEQASPRNTSPALSFESWPLRTRVTLTRSWVGDRRCSG